MREWILQIERDVANHTLSIYFGYEDQDGLRLIMPEGATVERLVPEGVPIFGNDEYRPIISLPRRLAEPFLKEMARAISGMGVRTEAESKLEGELSATKRHLEDLRTLLLHAGGLEVRRGGQEG